MSRAMTWQEIYDECGAYLDDAIKYQREMSHVEAEAFMKEIRKALREANLIKEN